MHAASIDCADRIPELSPGLTPAWVHGTAAQAHRVFAAPDLNALLELNRRATASPDEDAALAYDISVALQLSFQPDAARDLQMEALVQCPLFRVADCLHSQSARPLRLLAIGAPGDLMVNAPLDFITQYLDVRLDLLFLLPGQALPRRLPDHDVAFFAVSDTAASGWRRLDRLYRDWPRPALNNPARIRRLTRDVVAQGLSVYPDICSPPAIRLTRADLIAHASGLRDIPLLTPGHPAIIRPLESHAGHDLEKLDTEADLAAYLNHCQCDEFFVTRFVDYRNADGLFQKYRVAFVDGAPFLCHMATSRRWMVHYLNAGMNEHADRRAEEARAMESFDAGFAARHARAFAALNAWMGLDYYQIDCAETPDGRLLVFEVDTAAIIHLMDPPELYPYKPAQMRRVFTAFGDMLRRRAGWATA
jgi:hypothetical protein